MVILTYYCYMNSRQFWSGWKNQCSMPVIFFGPFLRILKTTPWSESASELHRPSDRHLSAKWLLTVADRGCHMVSVTDPCGRIVDFLDRSCYTFLSSSSSVVLTRLSGPRSRPTTFFSGSARNRTQASGSVLRILWKEKRLVILGTMGLQHALLIIPVMFLRNVFDADW
jgi:hypothetical protein